MLPLLVALNSPPALQPFNKVFTAQVETVSFPTVQELKTACDNDPSCVKVRNEAAAEAEDRRLATKSLSELHEAEQTNTYAPGNCTWYVASKRKTGEFWGNANNWLHAAKASGYETGAKPFKGAVAYTPEGWAGHVGLVEEVEGDSVTISEMNYNGQLYKVNVRKTLSSNFSYIY